MPRRPKPLTATFVEKGTEPGRFADGGGLYLFARSKDAKFWVFRYMRHGRSHDMGLGSAVGRNAVKLAEARERTRELHAIVRRDGRDPPYAGALRARLALKSAAACAKILRINGDKGALRDLRFAVGDDSGPAAKLLRLWREFADGRPPSTRAGSSPRQPRSTWLYPTRTASHPT